MTPYMKVNNKHLKVVPAEVLTAKSEVKGAKTQYLPW